jgi:hypothetical protein
MICILLSQLPFKFFFYQKKICEHVMQITENFRRFNLLKPSGFVTYHQV